MRSYSVCDERFSLWGARQLMRKCREKLRTSIALTVALTVTLALSLTGCSDAPLSDAQRLSSPGGWTFVNYWAQWCKPCIKEIPELNALHALPGYTVLGVNYDGAVGEELQLQLDALGVAFPTLAEDPASRFGLERPQVLPTTLVLAPGGELRQVLIGPQTEATLLAAAAMPTQETLQEPLPEQQEEP
jgi:thiol-disulfide isomerase/thioredoxin